MAENYRIMSQCLQHEKSGEKEGGEEGRVESVFKKKGTSIAICQAF